MPLQNGLYTRPRWASPTLSSPRRGKALEARVRKLAEDGQRRHPLVLDLAGVSFVDSEGAAKITELHELTEADNSRWAISLTARRAVASSWLAPWLDQRMKEQDRPREPPLTPSAPATDVVQRTSMAAERTWLAWWRTALAATVGSLGVGRLAPELLDVAPWPYVVLGAGYAGLAVGLLVIGARRQRDLEHAIHGDSPSPLSFRLVALFTVGGVLLALTTVVLVIAQT